MDLRLIANVGSWTGSGGTTIVYAAKTPGGTNFLAVYFANTSIMKWKYLPIGWFTNLVASGEAAKASDLNVSLFTDQEKPEFIDEEDQSGGLYTLDAIINGGTSVPKSFTGQGAYTIKGEGATDAEVSALKVGGGTGSTTGTGTGTTTGTGTLGGVIPSASEFNRLFSDPLGFIRTNILFVVAVLVIVYYMRRKKKKPLWIF